MYIIFNLSDFISRTGQMEICDRPSFEQTRLQADAEVSHDVDFSPYSRVRQLSSDPPRESADNDSSDSSYSSLNTDSSYSSLKTIGKTRFGE